MSPKFYVVRSLRTEHLAVDEGGMGSNPIDPPISILDWGLRILDWRHKSKIPNPKSEIEIGAVAERRMHFAVDEDDDGSSPFGPANNVPVTEGQKFNSVG